MTMNDVRKSFAWILAPVAGLALAVAACGKDSGNDKPAEPAEPAAAPAKADPAPAPAATGDEAASLDAVLDVYEQIHAQLAKDDVAAAAQSAATLEGAAKEAAGGAPAELQAQLTAVATAAAAMQKAPVDDPDAVRKAFGEVSKPMVEVLSAAPDAREGWHVFECPMAQGYQRWVQPTAELSNPYMGSKMPSCGSEVDWTTGG